MSSLSQVADLKTHAEPVHVLRRIFSFPVMLASLLVALAVLTVRARFNDPDMWWHLKTGEVIRTTHTFPVTDLFSYTTNHHALIPHEWLSQLVIYEGYRWGGYSGLMLWLCFFAAALLIAGYILCSLYSGNSKTAFLGALVIWLFSTTGFSVRPQLIGYFLLVIELLVVHLGRTRSSRWFFALPPLFAVWVNCHGSFLLGYFMLSLFLLCSNFDFRMGLLVSTRWDLPRRRTLAFTLFISTAALFLNPGGVKQILYPLNTMLHQPVNLSQISEWQPLQWSSARGVALLAVLVCVFLLLILRRSELFLHELMMLAVATWLAINHARMAFIFGILVAPVLSRLLSTSWDNYSVEKDHPWPNAALIGISLMCAFLVFPNYQFLVSQINNDNPVKAVEYIKSHHLSGNMLNSYVYGGYLIWALPEHPVFLDGRADLFEWAGILGEYSNWWELQGDPLTLLNKYNVGFCLLERGSAMARVLPLLPGWKIAYADSVSVIIVRSAP